MRVAINTRFLLPGPLEGIGRFTLEVSRRLVERHPDWDFLFLFDRPYDKRYILGPNVRPIVVSPPARHPILFYLWFEWAVPKVLKKNKADVFFSPDNFGSLRAPCPTLIVCHDLAFHYYPDQVKWSENLYYQNFILRYFKKASHLLAVSEYTQQDMLKTYGLPPEKVSVTCNAADESFQPLETSQIHSVREQYSAGQPYFFYVGSIHPRKNIARLIKAFDRFKRATLAPAKLLLAGRMAWQTGEVKAALQQLTHPNDIVFLGYVPDEQLPDLLGASLALTYVSLFEGFGVPILEAMHTNVPVITANRSSMPEVAGDAALLVDPESEHEIAQAMQQIWEDESLREDLIGKGKLQRERFSWERAVDVVETALWKCKM